MIQCGPRSSSSTQSHYMFRNYWLTTGREGVIWHLVHHDKSRRPLSNTNVTPNWTVRVSLAWRSNRFKWMPAGHHRPPCPRLDAASLACMHCIEAGTEALSATETYTRIMLCRTKNEFLRRVPILDQMKLPPPPWSAVCVVLSFSPLTSLPWTFPLWPSHRRATWSLLLMSSDGPGVQTGREGADFESITVS